MTTTPGAIVVRPLTEADLPIAAGVLTAAFLDDPFYTYAIPERITRLEQLPPFFATCLQYGLRFGQAWVAGRRPDAIESVAYGYTYPESYFNRERTAAVGFDVIDRMLGEASQRITAFSRSVEEIMEPCLPPERFNVDLIGTRPESQGIGIGAALIAAIDGYARSVGLPVALWTETPSALRFYRRVGFDLAAEGHYEPADAAWWALCKGL
jgi:GNAT superfamily N-acetyltransferase